MSPRPRKRNNSALPPNLYRRGRTHFRYRHPQTGKFHGMGSDKAKAIAAAKELNSLLVPENNLVVGVVGQTTVVQHVDWFFKNVANERDYRPKTLEMYRVQSRKLIRQHGQKAIEDVTVQDLAVMMEAMTARTANQFRQVMVELWKAALGRGLCDHNVAASTLKRTVTKARQRLSLAEYQAIYERAPLWLRNAMDLALITLQRREDVSRLRFDEVRDGCLYVVQGKTEKYDSGYLKISIGPKLEKVISQCRDDIPSPYLVHRKPERRAKRTGADHWTQVKPEMISRAFAKARDASGVCGDMPAAELPTFHEIRALGIKLYRDQGKDPQKLAGHASEQMTSNYDSDHDDIRWVETRADLDV